MAKQKDQSLPPARAVALECLTQIIQNGRDVQSVLDYQLQNSRISLQDASLCTELVYGYLRMQNRLFGLLGRFLKDASKLPAKSRMALGLAAYEMLFLDRIPVYASVDWCVTFIKKRFSLGLGKLANAVLRNLDRMGEEAHDPQSVFAKGMAQAAHWSIWYSCPEWIVSLLIDGYGEEIAKQYLESSLKPAPLGIRVNRTHGDAEAVLAELTSHEHCFHHNGFGVGFPAGHSPKGMKNWLTNGVISRQSLASQEVLRQAMPEKWTEPVWDCCCGRGGKTTALLEAGIDICFASDTSRTRILGLRDETERLGLEQPYSLLTSASTPLPELPEGQIPKTILADVPCSGLGTLSRRPDVRNHRTPEDVAGLVATQAEILSNTWNTLPAGGQLVYMTCTMNPDENEKQIAKFLQRTPDATLTKEWSTPPDSPFHEFFYLAILQK